MFVGSFEGDFFQFQTDTDAAIKSFQAAGVTRLIIDLSNNGGRRDVSSMKAFKLTLRKVLSFASDSSSTSTWPVSIRRHLIVLVLI